MRIPRKHILEQKQLIIQLHKIKFVHYRDLNKNIDITNFQLNTKVDFKGISQDPNHNHIKETWNRVRKKHEIIYYYKSKYKSEYVIDEDNNVYRFSNHWGAVASCEWTREGHGQLSMSVFENGDWEIGMANLNDFKIFRRCVDRRCDKIINPEWVEQMKLIYPAYDILKSFKLGDEFDNMSNDRKHFIGSNYGFFRKEINNTKKAIRILNKKML